jgi:hypothetical protein
MSDYPFDDFSPREIAVSLVPKPSVDEGLPSDTGTGVSAGDTVGMMIPQRGAMTRRSATRHTRGLMIDPPTGDSLAGDGTRGMMPQEPRNVDCSFPMPAEEPEDEGEVPIQQGRAELSPETKSHRVSVGMNPPLRQPVRMQHRLESEKEQVKIGAEIEKEHTSNPKKARKIAQDHVKENPKYYPTEKKPKGCGEKLTWTCKIPAPPKE